MTKLAKEILNEMNNNPMVTAADMLAKNIGTTEPEVEFIMEQIRIAQGL